MREYFRYIEVEEISAICATSSRKDRTRRKLDRSGQKKRRKGGIRKTAPVVDACLLLSLLLPLSFSPSSLPASSLSRRRRKMAATATIGQKSLLERFSSNQPPPLLCVGRKEGERRGAIISPLFSFSSQAFTSRQYFTIRRHQPGDAV